MTPKLPTSAVDPHEPARLLKLIYDLVRACYTQHKAPQLKSSADESEREIDNCLARLKELLRKLSPLARRAGVADATFLAASVDAITLATNLRHSITRARDKGNRIVRGLWHQDSEKPFDLARDRLTDIADSIAAVEKTKERRLTPFATRQAVAKAFHLSPRKLQEVLKSGRFWFVTSGGERGLIQMDIGEIGEQIAQNILNY